ncbi:Acetolactate synthase isozyme 2 small subunit [compost metagenome]
MRQHQLQIQLRDQEGAVLRALGLIERRGFRLDSLHVGEASGDGRSMQVSVSSVRPGDLLKRQLERLQDVMWVEIRPPAMKLAGRQDTIKT